MTKAEKKSFCRTSLETPSIHLEMMMICNISSTQKITEKVVMFTPTSKRRVRQNPHRPTAGEVLKSWEGGVELQFFPLWHHFFGVPLKINLGDDYTPQGGNMSPQIHGPFLSKAKDRLPKTHVPVPLFFRRHVCFRGTHMSFS